MRRVLLAMVLTGCSVDIDQSSSFVPGTSADRPDLSYRGPGIWLPALETSAKPVDISLITTGLFGTTESMANGTGDHIAFGLDENACGVDAETGNMDTDTTVDGTSVEVSDISGDNTILTVSGVGIAAVTPGREGGHLGGGSAQMKISGSFQLGRYVGERIVGVTTDCRAMWEGGAAIEIDEVACELFEAAAASDALLFATSEGTVRVDPARSMLVDAIASEQIAVDGATGQVVTSLGSTVDGRAWQREIAGATIRDLVASEDLGVVLVDMEIDANRVVSVLDAATGEDLGTLNLRDSTVAIDLSRTGGLLVQMRGKDVVSWRISR